MFSRLVLSLSPSRNPEASMLSIGRSAGTLSDARSAGLVAAYVRTVKTASGGTAVQVHSAHYPRTFRSALDCIRRHSGAPG
jgi:hypothetical protein